MAIWHAGNTISNVISGFLAAGILYNMDGILRLHAWQWFFLIEGAVSILVAIAAFFLLLQIRQVFSSPCSILLAWFPKIWIPLGIHGGSKDTRSIDIPIIQLGDAVA